MIVKFSRQLIWKLKRHKPISGGDDKNLWEEFCRDYQGDSTTMNIWEDYVIAQISLKFEKLKEIDRFKIWLETKGGEYALQKFIDEKFDSYIPKEYLNLTKISQEISYQVYDIFPEVYSLIKAVASDYCLDDD